MDLVTFTGPLVTIPIGCAAAVGAGLVALAGRRFRGGAVKTAHLAFSAVAVAGICLATPLWIVGAVVVGFFSGAELIPLLLGLLLSLVPSVFIVVPLVETFAYQQQRFDPSLSERERFWRPYGI